jgi:hypothetical protein
VSTDVAARSGSARDQSLLTGISSGFGDFFGSMSINSVPKGMQMQDAISST